LSAGVTVAAAVAGPVVDPASVHPPTARSAAHQPRESVHTGGPILGRAGGANSLDGDEALLGSER
jgi:hypothetical protein